MRLSCFEFNKAELLPIHREAIRRLAEDLARRTSPPTEILLTGHGDHIGADQANDLIGQRRAERVGVELTGALGPRAMGVHLTFRSLGKRRPTASNRYPNGRALNRRVEIFLSDTPKPSTPPDTRVTPVQPTQQESSPETVPERVQRAIRLVQASSLSIHQKQRIPCVLLRLLWQGGDDRFITAQSVLDYQNENPPYTRSPSFSHVSQWLNYDPRGQVQRYLFTAFWRVTPMAHSRGCS